MGSMKGLKKLHVNLSNDCFEMELYDDPKIGWVAEEEFIFGPLREIRIPRLQIFNIEVD
jgi:hypothetical protein